MKINFSNVLIFCLLFQTGLAQNKSAYIFTDDNLDRYGSAFNTHHFYSFQRPEVPKGLFLSQLANFKLELNYDWKFDNHIGYRVSGILLVAMLFYFLLSWFLFLKPKSPIPENKFDPPGSFSPGYLRYFFKRGGDTKGFLADTMDLAAKGFLIFKKDERMVLFFFKNDYRFYYLKALSNKETVGLSKAQMKILEHINKEKAIYFDHHSGELESLLGDHERSIKIEVKDIFFRKRWDFLVPGIILFLTGYMSCFFPALEYFYPISEGIGILLAVSLGLAFTLFFRYFFKTFCTCLVNFILGLGGLGKTLLWLFSILFISIFYVCFFLVFIDEFLFVLIITYSYFFIFFIFYRLFDLPTKEGEKLQSVINNMKVYIKQYKFDYKQPNNHPDEVYARFVKVLPFAISLNLEDEWCGKFQKYFKDKYENDLINIDIKAGLSEIKFNELFFGKFYRDFSNSIFHSSQPPSSSD